MKKLTIQQKKFVTEYIKSLNGELSAKNAGYKSKDLKDTASRLLSEDLIIKEIKFQLKSQINSLRVNKGYVIQKRAFVLLNLVFSQKKIFWIKKDVLQGKRNFEIHLQD